MDRAVRRWLSDGGRLDARAIVAIAIVFVMVASGVVLATGSASRSPISVSGGNPDPTGGQTAFANSNPSILAPQPDAARTAAVGALTVGSHPIPEFRPVTARTTTESDETQTAGPGDSEHSPQHIAVYQPSGASDPTVYLQEGATLSSLYGGYSGFSAAWMNVTLPLSTPYSTGYEFNALSNTGDWYQVMVAAENWPHGFCTLESLYDQYEVWNNAGTSVDFNCDLLSNPSSGDTVALYLYVASNGQVCMEVYDWTHTSQSNSDCENQPDPGASPAENYFVFLPYSSNFNGYFTGPMTEVPESETSCLYYPDMPTATYYWGGTSRQAPFDVASYVPWSDEFELGGSLCYDHSSFSPLSTNNPATLASAVVVFPSQYLEASGGSVYGPHWVAGQETVSGWRFQTDVVPLSSPSVGESRASLDLGQFVTLTAGESGGVGAYLYEWGIGGAFFEGAYGNPVDYYPPVTGSYLADVSVSDALGDTSVSLVSTSFSVLTDPSAETPSATPTIGEVGVQVSFNVVVTGGSGAYSYVWSGLPGTCTGLSSPSPVCTPTAPGEYGIAVSVTDSNGFTAVSPTLTFTVGTVGKMYTITFTQTGLPSGTSWSVTVNGVTVSSAISRFIFTEPNGTYAYSIGDVSSWHQTTLPYTGSVTVSGAAVTKPTLAFTQVTYTVAISESTLPSGLSWSITLNGVTASATTNGGTYILLWTGLANGTYADSITGNSGWHQTTLPYSGSLTVNGGTNSISGTGIGYAKTLVYSQVTYSVTFTERGLPSVTTWSVTFNGATESSTSSSVTFSQPNGTYAYTVGTVAEYAASPSSGTVPVAGVAVNEAITFTEAYAVTFTETGLPSGTSWSVTLNGVAEGSASGTISFTEPNGVYSYSIGAVAGWHQTTLPYTGSVTVSGATVTESTLAFTQVTYSVTISESTLPSGLTWTVAVNGVQHSLTTDENLDTLAWTGLANGTYSYSITGISGWHQTTLPYSGSLTVNGGTNSISGTGIGYAETLIYSPVTYTATYTESGLPSGTSWSVTLGGSTVSSTPSTITFTEPNGTYTYTIGDVPGWHQTTLPYTGSVTISGAAVRETTLAFTQVTYTVTIGELTFPSGLSWSITLNGVTESLTTTGGTVTLTWTGLANGTYSYSIAGISGWHQTTLPYSGSLTVNGGTSGISGSGVGYAKTLVYSQVTYSVTFAETGLPSGTSWSIMLNGVAKGSTTGTIGFTEPNGTYVYTVADVPGWHQTTLAYTGSVTVSGSTVTESTLAFTQVTYSVTFTEAGLASGTEWYVNITGGSSFSSTTGTVAFTNPNGTYRFTIWTEANYTATTSGGTLTVTGAPAGESVTFVRTYGLMFDQPSGTPAGASWTVYVNATSASGSISEFAGISQPGIVRSTTASTLTILVPNGTYDYSIVVSGNPSLTTQGTATINGSPAVANPPPAPCSPFLGFCGATGYYILAAVVVVVAVVIGVVVVVLRRRRPPAVKAPPPSTQPPSPVSGGGMAPPPGSGPGYLTPTTSSLPARPPMSAPGSGGVGAQPASPEPRFCPYCGVQNSRDYSFCQKCGKPLPPPA